MRTTTPPLDDWEALTLDSRLVGEDMWRGAVQVLSELSEDVRDKVIAVLVQVAAGVSFESGEQLSLNFEEPSVGD